MIICLFDSTAFRSENLPDGSVVSVECLATINRKLKRAHRVSLFVGGRSCIKCWRASHCSLRFLIPGMVNRTVEMHIFFFVIITLRLYVGMIEISAKQWIR